MNYNIIYNGADVSSYVISFERTNVLCTGIGKASVTFLYSFVTDYTPNPYDTIVIYEDSIKKGTYYVDTIEISLNGTTVDIDLQDETKKIADYFIDESYVIDYLSYSKYWITKFLTEAGVNFTYDTTEPGSPISNNTTLGLVGCMETVTQLCQQSGWYFRVDEDGVFRIGKIDLKFGNEDITLPGTNEIIAVRTTKKDDILRNRVVVWGSANEDNQGWVYAESKIYTQYNYDQSDLRTAVLSSGNIYSNQNAKTLANRILKETQNINYIKEVEFAGFVNTNVAQTAFLDSPLYAGACLVTSISVRCTSQGAVTTLKLDERCPRLFAYFGYKTNYVYIGTEDDGVWRKPFETNGWTNFSSGLDDLHITDLAINTSIFACVDSSGDLYTRKYSFSNPSVWSKPVVSGFNAALGDTPVFFPSEVECKAVDIDRSTNEVVSVFTLSDILKEDDGILVPVDYVTGDYDIPEDGIVPVDWAPYDDMYWHSWLATSPDATGFSATEIIVNGSNNVYAYDVTNNGGDTFISCLAKIPNNPPARYNRNNLYSHMNDIRYGIIEGYESTTRYVESFNTSIVDMPEALTLVPPMIYNFGYKYYVTDDAKIGCILYRRKSGENTWYYFKDLGPVWDLGINPLGLYLSISVETEMIQPLVLLSYTDRDHYVANGYCGSPNGTCNFEIRASWEEYVGLDLFPDRYSIVANCRCNVFNNAILDSFTEYTKEKAHFGQATEYWEQYLPEHKLPSYVAEGAKVLLNFGAIAFNSEDTIDGRIYTFYVSRNPSTGEVTESYQLHFPDGTKPYWTGNEIPYFISDLDPVDGSCYAAFFNYNGQPASYPWSTIYFFAFDPLTGEIRRNYGSGVIYTLGYLGRFYVEYLGGEWGRLYKNNIYNYQSYKEVIDLGPSYPEEPNPMYNKMIRFELSVPPPYDFTGDIIVHGVAKKTDQGDFILLSLTPMMTKVEASQSLPLVAYGGNSDSNRGFLNVYQLGIYDSKLNEYTYLEELPPYTTLTDPMEPPLVPYLGGEALSTYVSDSRVFNWYDNSIDTIYVGFVKKNSDGNIYLSNYGGDIDGLDSIHIQDSTSFSHMETTNYQDVPYMFACTNTAPSDFFEKKSSDMGEVDSSFVEYNSNIPSSKITCIRCDDKV